MRKILGLSIAFMLLSIAANAVEILPNPVSVVESGRTVSPGKTRKVSKSLDPSLAEEAYTLSIGRSGVKMTGGSQTALYWAEQTLRQVLLQSQGGRVPCLEIYDCPAFPYRGMLIDCSRHFLSVDDVKRCIDIMTLHKLNKLHWHLTDDQGWRLEIKKYPQLTQLGSVRAQTKIGHYLDNSKGYDGTPHGGYYTQEQVRDILAYAGQHHIEVIPEIEMPGHSQELLAVFPQFGCKGEGYEVRQTWDISHDPMCIGNPDLIPFLKDILDEVCDLFPSSYINIGGDEVKTDRWHDCPKCQAFMKEHGMTEEQQLQRFLVGEMEKYLISKGRKMIGWGEIFEGCQDSSTTVLSWRGAQTGISAAKKGMHSIMCPGRWMYLDYYQTPQTYRKEPLAIHRDWYTTLSKIYSYDPLDGVPQDKHQFVSGVQGNLWGEYIPNQSHLEHMALPRLAAVAEVAWSGSHKTSYANFFSRVKKVLIPQYEEHGFNYARYEFEEPDQATDTITGNTSAKWISFPGNEADTVSTWTAFRKDITLTEMPGEAVARIAADSKYWLWVNGEIVVWEGGLKRGPYRKSSSYYDLVDLSTWLKPGVNQIAVLLLHFGKSGFSHIDSGRSALYFELPGVIESGSGWSCKLMREYSICEGSTPNFRLSESNILYDARKKTDENWTVEVPEGFTPAAEVGTWGDEPWGEMVARPIPQWKLREPIELCMQRREGAICDTVTAALPYNMQMTPIITLTAEVDGGYVDIRTDHSYHGKAHNIRAGYIAVAGRQTYESLGWMNGEKIILTVPHGVTIESIRVRESGYDAAPVPDGFSCSSEFYNRFWQKGMRTLYVNMRDTFYDCPDRERSQWWGDVTVMTGELFYSFDTGAQALMRKAIWELCDWQHEDGVLTSPIPGNYTSELPGQMLASIGRYGFWNYYINTADKETLRHVYPAVKRYLALWKLDPTGLTEHRDCGWIWGDWGSNKDIRLIIAGWHSIALDGAALMADELGFKDDAKMFRATREQIARGYNKCWNGTAYRHPEYKDQTDDRVQALAVLAGIADPGKYNAIYEFLRNAEHASPYMERYVMEALFLLGHGDYALSRAERRYSPMVNDPEKTTLFEGWELESSAFGGGTSNHAWSGGPLIVLGSYVCGARPLKPGWKEFCLNPRFDLMESCRITIPSVSGNISSSWDNSTGVWHVSVPRGTKCRIALSGRKKTLRAGEHTLRYSPK